MRTHVFTLVAVAACHAPAASTITATSGATVRAVAVATCTPPAAGGDAEVRAAFGDREGCVALIDAGLSPVSATPLVWRQTRGTWREVDVAAPHNHGWIAAATDGDRIVAVLDSCVESPGWELAIVHSDDGGRTWSPPARVRKPYYVASVERVTIGAGEAVVELELDDDLGSGVALGRYRAVSSDRGDRWAPPRLVGGR
jgi:hypothetical protein